MAGKWKTLESKELLATKFFKLRVERCEIGDGRTMPDYYILDFANWVNIVPLTEEGHVILIEQYRHASGKVQLEIPGGMVDRGEEPQRSALRELEEETGYVPTEIVLAGSHYPNPATQNNQMFTYVAFGCRKEKAPNLDEFEDIRVITKTVPELLELVKSGEIQHSLILASIFKALPLLGCNFS